jgi:hypothetical protein
VRFVPVGWGDTLRRLRPVDWVRLAALALMVVVVLIIETTSGGVRHWFTERPLQAGIVSGVLLALVAAAGIDAVRAQIANRRWDPLVRLAFLAIAYQTTLLIDTVLWLISGKRPSNEARPDHRTHRHLLRLRRRSAGLRRPSDDDLGDIAHQHLVAMLSSLIHSPEWRRFAVAELDRAKFRHRGGIGLWAAAMLTTGESADVLKRSAALNEWLSNLQTRLRHLNLRFDDALCQDAVQSFLDWLAEAFSLREDFNIVARGGLPPDLKAIRQRTLSSAQATDIEDRERGPEPPRRRLMEPFRLDTHRLPDDL